MDLSNLKEKLKEPITQVMILVILVASLSFGLGYLSAKSSNPAPIIIEKNSN